MKCFDETTYAVFLDNETEPAERRKIIAHLETCETCSRLVRHLEAENRQLQAAFSDESGHPNTDLETVVMARLRPSGPAHDTIKKTRGFQWMGLAAGVFLACLCLFHVLWQDKNAMDLPGSETQILICDAKLGGSQAQSHIMNDKNPDIKFIWFEKQ
ncbi:MAG: hypothetical protein GY765_04555 [bacterium]|nr:hypothetical protein [bacterium]